MRFFNPAFIRNYNRYYIKYPFLPRQTDNTVLNVSGVWDTSYGELILIQIGNRVTGYAHTLYDLIIEGRMEGNILTGNWSDDDIEGKNRGQFRLDFSLREFVGKWGYSDKPFYYSWRGKKVSSTFSGYNCYRYRIRHDSPELPEVVVNDERISYGEQTSYFYPEECSDFAQFQLFILDEIIIQKIPVEPGFSYTFLIQGNLPNITIDLIVDNPFLSKDNSNL